MQAHLKRHYGYGHSHFITCSCYRRQPLFAPRSRPARADRQTELWPSAPSKTRHFWQPRFHDFNLFTRFKFIQKLRYIHRNPVARGLVEAPEQWRCSSYRFYAFGEKGPVMIGYDLSQMWPDKKAE